MKNLDTILQAYLVCALWSSNDEDGEPLDSNFTVDDFSVSFTEQAKKDIKDFVELAGDMLNDWEESQIGHDFWLTRNGHGAGFWDRDLPYGKELSALVGFRTKFSGIDLCIIEIDGQPTIDSI
jgi:hypothetical protein